MDSDHEISRMTLDSNSRLPRESFAQVTYRDIQYTALGVLLLVLLANVGAYFHLQGRMFRPERWLLHGKWQTLKNLKEPVDWIVLGDSSAAWGISQEIMEKEINGKAVNLGTAAATLVVNDAWMLQKYLHRHKPPRSVLIIRTLNAWRSQNRIALTNVPLPFGFWGRLRPPVKFSNRLVTWYLLNRYAPLWSQTKHLHPKEIRKNTAEEPYLNVSSRGFIEWPKPNPKRVQVQINRMKKRVRKKRFKVSKVNRKALEAIAQLSQNYGFDVFVASAPVARGVSGDSTYRRVHDSVMLELEAIAMRHKRVHLIMPVPMRFNRFQMQNVDHLTTSAAKSYTEQVVRQAMTTGSHSMR